MYLIKENADKILYSYGLFQDLEKYGTPHIIGSYAIDAMVINDLDIDITNENMDMGKLYQLTSVILKKFTPVWYEAKQETNSDGKTVWFHGFETMVLGELWNIDLWFFDYETIRGAEEYCDRVKQALDGNSVKREAVLQIKKELINQGLYSFDKFTGMDVYEAVLEKGILTAGEFLQNRGYSRRFMRET